MFMVQINDKIASGFVVEVGQRHIGAITKFRMTHLWILEIYAGGDNSNFEPLDEGARTIVEDLLGFSEYHNSYYVITDSPEFATEFANLIDDGNVDVNSTKEEIEELIDLDLQWLPVERL